MWIGGICYNEGRGFTYSLALLFNPRLCVSTRPNGICCKAKFRKKKKKWKIVILIYMKRRRQVWARYGDWPTQIALAQPAKMSNWANKYWNTHLIKLFKNHNVTREADRFKNIARRVQVHPWVPDAAHFFLWGHVRKNKL